MMKNITKCFLYSALVGLFLQSGLSAATAGTSHETQAPIGTWTVGQKLGVALGGVGVSGASIAITYLVMRALNAWKNKQEYARMRAAQQVRQIEIEHERDALLEKSRKLEQTIVDLSNIVSRRGKGQMLADRIVTAASRPEAVVPLTSSHDDGSVLLAQDHLNQLKGDFDKR